MFLSYFILNLADQQVDFAKKFTSDRLNGADWTEKDSLQTAKATPMSETKFYLESGKKGEVHEPVHLCNRI